MTQISIVGLFCEDVRQEQHGTVSLVGIMQDNITIEKPKSSDEGSPAFPKLGIYVRMTFAPTAEIGEISLRLTMPDGEKIPLGTAPVDIIKQAKEQADKKGNPIAGVISRAILVGLKIANAGLIKLEAVMPDETRLVGILNVQFPADEGATSPTS